MLTDEQRAVLESLSRMSSPYECDVLRSILYGSAAPAEGREFAYPTVGHWLTEIAGEREVGHTISEMTHMEVARQAFAAARAGIATATTKPAAWQSARLAVLEEAIRVTAQSQTTSHACDAIRALATAPTMSEAALTDGLLSVLVTEARRAGNYQEAFERVKRKVTRLAEIERIDRAAAKGESDGPISD